jgi:hypothetical protein
MGFRLAILRDLKTDAGLSIAVEYDKAQFSSKLQARVRDYLRMRKPELTHDEDGVLEVVKFAFAAICAELKDETLTIP